MRERRNEWLNEMVGESLGPVYIGQQRKQYQPNSKADHGLTNDVCVHVRREAARKRRSDQQGAGAAARKD